MFVKLIDEVYSLYNVAFLNTTKVTGAIVDTVYILTDTINIDPKEADVGITYITENTVENTFLNW